MGQRFKAVIYFLFLAISFIPIVIFLILPSVIISKIVKSIRDIVSNRRKTSPNQRKKIVLVTGAPHTKGLQVCRILKQAGHRVILADMQKFRFSASRFSNNVDSWFTLPNVTSSSPWSSMDYKMTIKKVLEQESVDWWIPVSHTSTAVLDTTIKMELEREESRVKVLSLDNVDVAEMLDDKISFLEDARTHGLPVPDFYQISSCQDVVELCRQNVFSGRHFFLKPLNPYSEDRVCFDRIPEVEAELNTFLERYKTKISPSSPYFVSQFVQGEEWTGNVIAKDGQIYIYTANPSSPMQIDYQDASYKTEIFNWVNTFISKKKLSGSLCFDFIEDSGKMLAIECNPRLHSAIVLMDTRRDIAATAIYNALEQPENNNGTKDYVKIVSPDPQQPHIYWTYNELAKILHGGNVLTIVKTLIHGRDAVWDWEDPLPFFLLPHLQIPSLLLQAIRKEDKWEIVNFCLGQLR